MEADLRILYYVLTGKLYWDYWRKQWRVSRTVNGNIELELWALEQIRILKNLRESRRNGGRKEANQFAYSAC